MAGPLAGLRIIEFAGIGPGPFCAMMLADHGAEVIRIDRTGREAGAEDPARDILNRSRRSIALNLKDPRGVALARELSASADGVIEGFRPGVMERLGLGPDIMRAANPRLVYGRMTGWGQAGPYAHTAGHDINYIAISGALHAIGRKDGRPVPPLNLVGDYGGGGMMLAFGMVAALLHAQRSGAGQVVDAAMSDGAAVLMTMMYSLRATGRWEDGRERNLIDGGAHFYDAYETSDGKYISIGPVEPQFYRLLLDRMGLGDDPVFASQMDRSAWPAQKVRIAEVFASRTRDEWCAILEGTDACFAPVMSLDEAPHHAHNKERATFVDVAGTWHPAPAPRYSDTPSAPPRPLEYGAGVTDAVLAAIGIARPALDELRRDGVVG